MEIRTHTCGELNREHIGKSVILNGWINTVRLHGQVVFIDLRDRYGKTQIVFNSENYSGDFELVKKLSLEDVVSISGSVQNREEDAINTGSYYDYVDSNIIVSASQYNSMSLNSNARTNIQSLDKFQVGLIEAYSDYANDKNNTLDDWQDGMKFYSADAAGATDPYLYVVWDEPEIPAVLHLKSGKINIIGGKIEIV